MRIFSYFAIVLMVCGLVGGSPTDASATSSAHNYAVPNLNAPSAEYEGWDTSTLRFGDNPYKIVFFGDSVLSGYGLENPETHIFHIILTTFEKEFFIDRGILLRNLSHEGETSASAVKRIKHAIALQPDIVVLSVGMNDALYGTDPDILYNNLEMVILELHRAGIYTMFTGMQATTKYGYGYLSKFNSVYAKLAQKYPVVFLPNLMQGVSGNRLYLQNDGFYPNQDGAKIIATNLMRRLHDMFKQYKRYHDHIEALKTRQRYMMMQNRGRASEGMPPMFSQQQIDAVLKEPMPAVR